MDEKLIFLNMATFYQQKMGYKVSWIYVVFKEKFGVWPNELLKQRTPIRPSNAFVIWVKEYQKKKQPETDSEDKNLSKGEFKPEICDEAILKLTALKKRISRKGKTAKELAGYFGISIRSVQSYTSMPREEYEANAISRAAPWKALGISRATWYRKGKPDPQSPAKPEPSHQEEHKHSSRK